MALYAADEGDLVVPEKLSLREAVRLGLSESPQLKQARVSLLSSQSSLNSARDLSDTNVFGNISQSAVGGGSARTVASGGARITWDRRVGDSLSATLVPAATSSSTSNLNLQYRKPLIRQSGTTSSTNVSVVNAEYSLATQDSQFFLTRQNIAQTIVRNYFNAVRARDLIKVSEADVDIAKETVRVARRRLEEGLVAEIEVSRAEIQLAQSEDALVERRRAYREALDTLLLSMGAAVGQNVELLDAAPAERITPEQDALVQEALTNRKDVQVQDIAIRRQELDLAVAGDDLRPSLDVVGSYTKAGLGISGGSAFQSQSYWAGGLEYSLPLGSTSRKERRNIATRQLQQLLVDRDFLRQEITNDVLSAIRNLNAVAASLDIYSSNLQVAQDNLQLAQRMVDEGLVTNRDVLEAQVSLTRTRASLLSGQIDYYLALINLERVLGRDLAERLGG